MYLSFLRRLFGKEIENLILGRREESEEMPFQYYSHPDICNQ